MATKNPKQEAVDSNYEAFKRLLPAIIGVHANQYALMRNGDVVEYFDTAKDAFSAGSKIFEDGLFSVQKVTDSISDLGYYSHAMPNWCTQQ
ncbi:MAG: hypothetical protein SFX19_03895 [Alphaproteobacteria bacterium]|nr:hypothetical protein [Alphaproteobacteria bacterium]